MTDFIFTNIDSNNNDKFIVATLNVLVGVDIAWCEQDMGHVQNVTYLVYIIERYDKVSQKTININCNQLFDLF